jgi:membrane protein DedA with SNARE-associated domain
MADAFQSFVEWFADYGYPVLAAGVLLENAGLPVPGETALLAAGFIASPAGGSHLNIVLVIIVAAVAAVIGDNVGFWLGRRFARPRLVAGRRFLFLTPKTLRAAEGYFERYGSWTVFFARFITGLRVVGALAAGTAGMKWGRFLLANAAGAVAWSMVMGLLGYFFGHSFHLLHGWLTRGGMILLVSVLVLAGLAYLLHRLRKTPFGQRNLARAQVVQGIIAAALEVACIAVLVALAQGRHTDPMDEAVVESIKHSSTLGNIAGVVGSWAGSLPVTAAVTLAVLTILWRQKRRAHELGAAAWALAASEALGLILVVLLRSREITPVRAETWPFGFAGLIPLRAFAVYGMAAYLATRRHLRWRPLAWALAAVPILLAGFGVVWAQEQTPTEVLLEYVAGAIVLFAGISWAEGFAPGLHEPGFPHQPAVQRTEDRGEKTEVRGQKSEVSKEEVESKPPGEGPPIAEGSGETGGQASRERQRPE